MIKRENYLKRIRPFIGKDLVKIITGIRRSGKSVMLKLIQEELLSSGIKQEQIVSINLEDMRFQNLKDAVSLREEILNRTSGVDGKVYVFLDEIQEVNAWEKCINSLQIELDCDLIITGSNATLLSGEFATYLSGRYITMTVYPFSFSEFLESYRLAFPEKSIRDCFAAYLKTGGMPYLGNLNFDEDASRQYLEDIFNTVEIKDIITRNSIKNVALLERIINYVTSNIGNIFSATSISKYLKNEGHKVAPSTIQNYLKACENAYLFYPVQQEKIKGKKLLSTNEKYYIADHGIREAKFGTNLEDINLVLENIVYLELRRRDYNVTVGRFGEKEIDFIARKAGETIYIQVTYLLASEETINREFAPFSKIKDNYPKFVISMDELDLSRNGYKHWNICDFLLADKWT